MRGIMDAGNAIGMLRQGIRESGKYLAKAMNIKSKEVAIYAIIIRP